MSFTTQKDKGDCDCCPTSIDVVLYKDSVSGMLMCESCRDEQIAATDRAVAANSVIQQTRTIDSGVKTKQDVHIVVPVPVIELRAAIDNDEAIKPEDKDLVFAQECQRKLAQVQEAIFGLQQEAQVWRENVQTAVGKLRADARAKFQQFDINYKPAPVAKTKKVAQTKVPAKKFNKAELVAASQKYGVPMAQVQHIAVAQNLNAEDAAKKMAEMMGLLN